MSLPAIVPPLIAAGSSILGTAGTIAAQGSMNRKTRKWNEKMYDIQRQHALADWTMQNEYNAPLAQMQRLRDANLNPHLVYKGGATNEAGVVRSSSAPSWHPDAPRIDLSGVGSGLMAYYDIKMKEAQIDNLKTQNTVAVQDALLRAAQVIATNAQTAKTGVDTAQGKFNLQMAEKLQNTTLETAQQNLRKLEADTDYVLSNNERQAALTQQSLAKGAEEILKLRSETTNNLVQRRQIEQAIRNLQKDETLKDLDIELRRLGITSSDPLWSRILGRIVGDPSNLNGVKEFFKTPVKAGKSILSQILARPWGVPW